MPQLIDRGRSTPSLIVDILSKLIKRKSKETVKEHISYYSAKNRHESTKSSDILALKSYQGLVISLNGCSFPEAFNQLKRLGVDKFLRNGTELVCQDCLSVLAEGRKQS